MKLQTSLFEEFLTKCPCKNAIITFKKIIYSSNINSLTK